MVDRLELEARFNDKASAGVKKLGKTLEGVRPTNGMEAANAWARNFRKEADAAFKTIRPLQSGLSGLGVGGLAAGFSLGEIVRQMRELADSTAHMKELGRQSGMATVEIERLQYAAKKVRIDPSAVTSAIDTWSSKMLDFRNKMPGIYTDLMKRNGDVVRKMQGEGPAEQLKESLKFLAQIPDPQVQKRWAEDFGLGDLMPMLSKGAEGVDAALAEATREVKPMTAELKAQTEALNDSLNKLDTTWSNFKRDFAPTVISGITGATDELARVLKEVEAAHDRYSGHPENVTNDAKASEDSIGQHFVKHWQEVIKGERPLFPNPLDKDSWRFPNVKDGLFDYTKGGDGPTPSGFTLSRPGQTQRGEDGNVLHRHDDDLSPIYRAALRDLERSRQSASAKWVHPDDDRLSRARPGDLKEEVREGSKQGIIQGLRELAQQQELDGGPGSGTGAGAGDRGRGLPSLRYGRGGASGAYRHTPGQKYDLSEGGLGSRAPIGNGLFKSKAPGIAARLKQDFPGLSDEDTAAILGNLGHESAGFTAFEEDHGRGPGRGWAQWTDPGRKARFFQFAKEHGLDPKSDDASYGFMRWELTHTHKAAMDALRGAQGVRAKTRAFEGIFEGAGVKAWGSRDRYADSALAAIRGASRAPATPGAGTPAPSAAAVTDAERFAAQQRIINGSRDPKDRAIIDRYLKEQNSPKASAPGHRAGGWIRGPGGPTADRVPAMLSNGEFVVNARASGQWAHLLHAINSGDIAHFAGGGPVGFGVAKQFYPKFTPGISAEEGHANRQFWRNWLRRPNAAGGMGASWRTTLGTMAMLAGESGFGLNSKTYGWDVNGPSGGVEQWHDVTEGRMAGKIRRLSDLMTFAMRQHADWKDPLVQAAFKKHEDTTSFAGPWRRMLAAKTARGALKEGIDHVEIPANKDLELLRRMPNIVKLQREAMAEGAVSRHEVDPIELNIRHHPHTGHPIVTARAGKGVRLGIRSGPTMRPT